MKILVYNWKAFSNRFIKKNFEELNHDVSIWEDAELKDAVDEAVYRLYEHIKNQYDLVFSFNYFRGVALACLNAGIPYAAWTQDAPLLSLFDETVLLENNYVFCFDSEQYYGLKNRGKRNVFYLPLGVDTDYLCNITRKSNADKRFCSDISFVGSLYNDKSMLGDIKSQLSQYVQGYLDAFMNVQLIIPEMRFSQAEIDERCMSVLKSSLNFEGDEYVGISFEELMENLVDRHVTVLEREAMLRICRDFEGFKLYTNSTHIPVNGIYNAGTVDYYTEMPLVFNNSKINLNPTLRSIHCGIPLRVLDVIASGGFVLTNEQPDLWEYFEKDVSVATYYNMCELEEKIDYYLDHAEERKKVIKNGMEIVKERFDYKVLIARMLDCIK